MKLSVSRPALAILVAALPLAAGCTAPAADSPAGEAVGSVEQATNALDWSWNTHGFQANGNGYTLTAQTVHNGATYTFTMNGATIAPNGSTLSYASINFSDKPASGATTTATAGAGSVRLASSCTPSCAPTTVTAGSFSIQLALSGGLGGHNYILHLSNITQPGSSQLLPEAYGGLAVSASASNVTLSGTPIVGKTWSSSYSFGDSLGLGESGTQLGWYRNDVLVGIGSSYVITAGDVNKYVKVCVFPSNTRTVGATVPKYCSSAVPVPSVVSFSGKNYTGTATAMITPSNACLKGLATGATSGSVIINDANGVSDGGACADSANVASTVPAGATDVTSSLTAGAIGAVAAQGQTTTNGWSDPTWGSPTIDNTPTLVVIYTYQSAAVIRWVVEAAVITITS